MVLTAAETCASLGSTHCLPVAQTLTCSLRSVDAPFTRVGPAHFEGTVDRLARLLASSASRTRDNVNGKPARTDTLESERFVVVGADSCVRHRQCELIHV